MYLCRPKKIILMKKQKVYLILASLLAILLILAIVHKKGGFDKSVSSNLSTIFAVKDTANVTKIFMANMFGDKVLLTKTSKGWIVDNVKSAADYKIRDLLSTMATIRVAQPIAKKAQNSIIQMLAVNSRKVEIYETKPLFKLFGYPFFTRERLSKIYYLGDATPNSLGSYASIEGHSEPYVVYQPGFRGYITPQFSPSPTDWYSQRVFNTKLTQIQSASFVDVVNPENSFSVVKSGPRSFNLYDVHNNAILHYDTTRLINMLSEFRTRHYETLVLDLEQSEKDSIIQSEFFKSISVTDITNQTTTLYFYYLIDEGSLYEDDVLIEEYYSEINRNRCYATLNDNTDEFYTIQFFQFDRLFQPLSYFLQR